MSDEFELENAIPDFYKISLNKIFKWEVREWIKYKNVTGELPTIDLIKLSRGEYNQNGYTYKSMLALTLTDWYEE